MPLLSDALRGMATSPSFPTVWRPSLGGGLEPAGSWFRVWAPRSDRVELVCERGGRTIDVRPLTREPDGCHAGVFDHLSAGQHYRYLVDGHGPYPDPASRFQPQGVHGPSELIDPSRFDWSDRTWVAPPLGRLVLYEIHVGTFTDAGTFAGVTARLPYLVDLGVTAIELMPLADFAGSRNWGYDGVALFAPARCYGRPDDLRRLVDRAHALGLAVYLDVVYNHLGPDGAYLSVFSPFYVSSRHHSPWGDSVNLDGDESGMARAFCIENALHWLHEYHLDGLRLDATHTLIDDSPRHWLAELAERVHRSGLPRPVHLMAEDERNLVTLVRPASRGGLGLDAVWADDFHHTVRRLTAGDHEGYFQAYPGSIGDVATTLRRGWLFVGEPRPSLPATRRGTNPEGTPLERFVICLQNHDQVGNRALGERLHHQIDLAVYRALTALLLCAPETPLLFMGQEWAVTTPFLFFTDHDAELGRRVTEGRRHEFREFSSFADPAAQERIPDPQALSTFVSSRLRWSELAREPHRSIRTLYARLLQLRRTEPALRASVASGDLAIEAIGDLGLVMRRDSLPDRLLVVVNLGGGAQVELEDAGESVRRADGWTLLLTTEDPPFSPGGRPPALTASRDGSRQTIDFHGPAAAILKSSGPS